jgi:hypothetical protein
MKPGYYVETWCPEQERFTPQDGVPAGPYSLFGLRAAIRALRDLGYPCDYRHAWDGHVGDPSVSIWREDA